MSSSSVNVMYSCMDRRQTSARAYGKPPSTAVVGQRVAAAAPASPGRRTAPRSCAHLNYFGLEHTRVTPSGFMHSLYSAMALSLPIRLISARHAALALHSAMILLRCSA